MESTDYEILIWVLADRPLIFNVIAIITIILTAEILQAWEWIKKQIEQMRLHQDQEFWGATL